MSRVRGKVALVLAVLLAVGGAGVLEARQAPDTAAARRAVEAQLGRRVTQAEIADMIRQSGVTRLEARMQLQQRGLDPRLADHYFDQIDQRPGQSVRRADQDVVRTLQALSLSTREPEPPQPLPAWLADSLAGRGPAGPGQAGAALADDGALQIFGRSFFRRHTGEFQPLTTGPVGPDYRLGPGDEIALVLTGDVELAYVLDVVREGYVVIPDVGQVFVNGLTLEELRDQLYERLGRAYSGVQRGANASTRFQLSLGRLRVNQVFLIGEVETPDGYQVSSVATVFNALYLAGGPSEFGSFRRIQVRRGGEVHREVDLYEYLLTGDSRGDIRLEHGDIVFVPLSGPRVSIEGAVRRPAIYELREGDDLLALLSFAGGLQPQALVRRIQIDRILAPADRRPGVDRILLDVEVDATGLPRSGTVGLQDGDIVQVFGVSEERRHRVVITGEVRRPGVYYWEEGNTLWDLIQRSEGLDERAYTPRAHIYRYNSIDGTRRLVPSPLLADAAGRPLEDVLLADRDSIVIYSQAGLRNAEFVAIDGYVKNPGTYPLADGMTTQDLILAAGGFVHGAHTTEAELVRLPPTGSRSDTTAHSLLVPLVPQVEPNGDAIVAPPASLQQLARGLPVWTPSAQELTLRHGDRVYVRKSPGYEAPREVVVTGELGLPGTYVLTSRQERLTDLLQRAGGLTREAHPAGFQLVRAGQLVSVDLPRALRDPSSRFNVVLQPGDSLHLPAYDPTVLVIGGVAFESRILYEPGRGLDYYIERAGGYVENADRRRITVTHQDGARSSMGRTLLVSRSPQVRPGSTIHVPIKPDDGRGGINWDLALTRTLATLSTLAAVAIAAAQLK